MEHIKMVTVGDGMVGKTCMLMSYTTDTFPKGYIPTIFDNYQAMIMYEQIPTSVSFWDTAGQEDYDRLRPLSYPNTDVFMVCYSVKSKVSLNNAIQKWIPEVKKYCPTASIVVVGTKSDCRKDEKEIQKLTARGLEFVDQNTARKLALEAGATDLVECSAKTQENLSSMISKCIKVVLNYRKKMTNKKRHRQPVCSIL